MSRLRYGEVTAAPDASGFGRVLIADADRLVWFQPERFAAPWPVPEAGDRVGVYHDEMSVGREWRAVWVIGRGTATYTFSGD